MLLLLRYGLAVWIFFVVCPPGGIVLDVFPEAVQRFLITDDVFVVVALPDG